MREDPDEISDWLTVRDVSEYAYCPRAFWYRRHPPSRGPTRASVAASAEGIVVHERHFRAVERRDRHGRALWWIVLGSAGLVLACVAALLAGL